jgi:hypothetical protein
MKPADYRKMLKQLLSVLANRDDDAVITAIASIPLEALTDQEWDAMIRVTTELFMEEVARGEPRLS